MTPTFLIYIYTERGESGFAKYLSPANFLFSNCNFILNFWLTALSSSMQRSVTWHQCSEIGKLLDLIYFYSLFLTFCALQHTLLFAVSLVNLSSLFSFCIKVCSTQSSWQLNVSLVCSLVSCMFLGYYLFNKRSYHYPDENGGRRFLVNLLVCRFTSFKRLLSPIYKHHLHLQCCHIYAQKVK